MVPCDYSCGDILSPVSVSYGRSCHSLKSTRVILGNSILKGIATASNHIRVLLGRCILQIPATAKYTRVLPGCSIIKGPATASDILKSYPATPLHKAQPQAQTPLT